MSKISGFNKICRACNNERQNLLNLFATDADEEVSLGCMFASCTALILDEKDDFPQNICYSCTKSLEASYKFKQMCLNTEKQLRKIIEEEQEHYEEERILPDIDNFEYAPEQEDDNFIDTIIEEPYTEQDDIEILSVASSDVEEVPVEGPDVKPLKIDPAPERPNDCELCDKKFFTSKALFLHVKLHHKNNSITLKENKSNAIISTSIEICKPCDLVFDKHIDYKKHIERKHRRVIGDYSCEICGKRFRTDEAMETHKLVHTTTNRPFSCDVCGKKFTEYKYLYRHASYHQPTIFNCTEGNCSRSFNVKHKYVEHLKIYHQMQLSNKDVRQIQPTYIETDIKSIEENVKC